MRWVRSIALLAALPLLFSACGGGSSASPSSPSASECLASAGLSGKVNNEGSASLGGAAVTIDAIDFGFRPTCLRANTGGTVSVTITNQGQALHNLSVTSLAIDKDVAAGTSVTVSVALPASGALRFFCKYHVASGMQGAFVIG